MRRASPGFTLIELMITVVIVGILSAVAVPSLRAFRNRSVRAEAYTMLNAIYNAEMSFYADQDYFSVSLYQIGVSVGHGPTINNLYCYEGAGVVCGKYYAAYVPVSSNYGFIAIAEGLPDPGLPMGLDEFVVSY